MGFRSWRISYISLGWCERAISVRCIRSTILEFVHSRRCKRRPFNLYLSLRRLNRALFFPWRCSHLPLSFIFAGMRFFTFVYLFLFRGFTNRPFYTWCSTTRRTFGFSRWCWISPMTLTWFVSIRSIRSRRSSWKTSFFVISLLWRVWIWTWSRAGTITRWILFASWWLTPRSSITSILIAIVPFLSIIWWNTSRLRPIRSSAIISLGFRWRTGRSCWIFVTRRLHGKCCCIRKLSIIVAVRMLVVTRIVIVRVPGGGGGPVGLIVVRGRRTILTVAHPSPGIGRRHSRRWGRLVRRHWWALPSILGFGARRAAVPGGVSTAIRGHT